LGLKQAGDAVNLEADLIGKYVDRLLQEREGVTKPDIRIDKDYLARRGLI
jgi:riboflavin synthase